MKIRTNVLRRYIDVPESSRELRDLLDDVGLEVKRTEQLQGDLSVSLELLANRGDHHCYAGIAREIGGRTGGSLRLPEVTALQIGVCPVPVQVRSPLCLRYTATLLERTGAPAELPDDVLRPIVAAGQKCVRAEVDATNLANLELGQPTHVFDADTIVGAVVVREAVAGETCLPLFCEDRVEVPTGALVVADDVKILAVAGVIGCEESKATATTTRLLVESATFDPVSVRKAARSMGISTDSSARFERGADPEAAVIGAGRVVHLLELYGGWSRVGQTVVLGDWRDPQRLIALSVPAAGAFLEVPLAESEIRQRLERYGFVVSPSWPDWQAERGWIVPEELADAPRSRLQTTLLVRVPSWRIWDVEFAADLYEELAKSIGYNNTPEHLPSIGLGSLPSDRELRIGKVNDVLVGCGFYEVVLDGFHGRDVQERLCLPPGELDAHVSVLNALDRGYSLLKNNCLAQALDGVVANLRVRNPQVKAYEWTRTFHPDKTADNGVCRERPVLWLIATGSRQPSTWDGSTSPADAWFVKGVVQSLAVELGVDLRVGPSDPQRAICGALHPGRQATILLDDRVVGVFGEVHPAALLASKIKRARPVYLEIERDALLSAPAKRSWKMPAATQAMERSLAFSLPHRVQAGDVAQTLRSAGPQWLADVYMTDLYAHVDDGAPIRSVTFELRFSVDGQSRSADEVNDLCERLTDAVHTEWGDRGVARRG